SRQDRPRVEDHAEIHPRPRALERQVLLHGQQDLADAEQPDDGHDEVEALHEIREAERHAELARHDVEPDRGEDEADQDRHQRLERVAPPSPTKLEKVRSWMAKNSGGPNFSATSARIGAKNVISAIEKKAPTN